MEETDFGTSRRTVLKSIVGAFGLGGSFGAEQHQDLLSSKTRNRQMPQGNRQASTTFGERPAYVALPGANMGSLLANISSTLSDSRNKRPVVFIDKHDYNWLKALASNRNNPLIQNQSFAYGNLRQRDIIRPIDYSYYYQAPVQQNSIQRNQALVESISDNAHQKTAAQLVEEWKYHARGGHLDPYRSHLGEDLSVSKKNRKQEEKREKKLRKGLGGPVEWNRGVLDQYVAALYVRRFADKEFNHFNVQEVIGEQESAPIKTILAMDETGERRIDTSHIENLDPTKNIKEPNQQKLAEKRNLFETISEVAVDDEKTQHNDWVMLDKNLATPRHNLFDIGEVNKQIVEEDVKITYEEVARVVDTLKRRVDDNPTDEYSVEWFIENESLLSDPTPARKQDIAEAKVFANKLAQCSRVLRSLRGKVSEPAALIGASIVTDSSSHDELNTFDRRKRNLVNQITLQGVSERQLAPTFRREEDFDGSLAWYETEEKRWQSRIT